MALRSRINQLLKARNRDEARICTTGRRIADGIPVIWRDQNGQLQPPGLRPLIDAGVERLAEQGVVMDVSQARPQTITHACRWILGLQPPISAPTGDDIPPSFPPGSPFRVKSTAERVRPDMRGQTGRLTSGRPSWHSHMNCYRYHVELQEHEERRACPGESRRIYLRAPLEEIVTFGTPVEQADGDAGQMQAGQRPRRQRHAPTPREDDRPQCHYMTWGKRCELNAVEGQDYCVEHIPRPRKTHALYSARGTSKPCQDWMDGNGSNAARDETDSGDHEGTQETTATDQSDDGPAQKKGKRW